MIANSCLSAALSDVFAAPSINNEFSRAWTALWESVTAGGNCCRLWTCSLRVTRFSMRPSVIFTNVRKHAKSTLLRRLTAYHESLVARETQQAAEQHARSILGWMKSSEACTDDAALARMVDDYVTAQKPLAYILGNQPFGKLDLLVEAPVLVPRPETEEWTYRLIQAMADSGDLQKSVRVLDICSGTGCIGLAIAQAAPSCEVVGLDISEIAVSLARRNAIRHRIANAKYQAVDIFDDSALNALGLGEFDMVVSNPPYIPPTEYVGLDKSVKAHEDPRALIGKRDAAEWTNPQHDLRSSEGLDFYYRLREMAKHLLISPSGRSLAPNTPAIIMEYGQGQTPQLLDIFKGRNVQVHRDFNGIERTLSVYQS